MNKAEAQQFAILSSNYRSEQEERRKAQKKASLLEQENSALKSKNEDMQRRLNEKMDEVADTVRQMAQFMMGRSAEGRLQGKKGPVTLSDSLRDAIVAGVKEEFEAKLREEREADSKEMQSLKDQFALMLAAKDNEIAALKARNGEDQGDAHGTVSHGQSIPEGMTPEDRNKQLSTGSPEASKRLARLLSHFANCKDHHLDSFTYLCDVFRRIKNTAKEDLVYLLEHRWQPMPALALA